MKRALLAVGFLGCGGGNKPPPAKPAVAAPVVDLVQPVKPVAPDCAAAARAFVAEHGFGKIPKEKQAQARLAAEAEVVAACLDDQWTPDTIACTTSRAAPSSCLGQLSEYQEQSFRAHISDWETNWTKGADRKVADDPPPPPEDDATPGELRKPTKEPAQEEWIPCRGSVGDPGSFEPKLAATVTDREYAVAVRRSALNRSCEFRWQNTAKKCFGAASDAGSIAACRGTLDTPDRNAITNAIADADARFAQVEALKKNAKAIDCKAIASAHYSDDLLRNKLTSLEPAERKRVFAESKQVMAAACTKEKWSPMTRACVALARPSELEVDQCFGTDEGRMTYRYGVPAQGVFFMSGIPECDALGAVVKKIAACEKYDGRMKEMVLRSYANWVESEGRTHLALAKQCKETQQYLEQDARERGCTL